MAAKSDDQAPCSVCDATPRVVVAIRHGGMRRLTEDLLHRECSCWTAADIPYDELLADTLRREHPDVIVLDGIDFPACCRAALAAFPRERIVVIGSEPDGAYAAAALHHGAGAWITRERVADELVGAMREILGCHHGPCPTHADVGPVPPQAPPAVSP